MYMSRILIADDEPSVRDAVCLALRRDGHEVVTAEEGISAWEQLKDQGRFDLAVLDIMMGGLEGTAILSRLRMSGSTLPVILLTSRDEELDRLGGFSLGADDYVGKPFSVRELCARVQAVLRRSRTPLPQTEAVSSEERGLRIDAEAFRAWYCGTEIHLTVSEFRILRALRENAGCALSREQLLNSAWPQDTWITERGIDSHVKRVRRKLAEAGCAEELIHTVYGFGYRMEKRDES
jgi:DNA-binding response OmpR family regulator